MKLEDYRDLTEKTDWAAFILVRVFRNPPAGFKPGENLGEKGTRNHIPLGYVFVQDPRFGPNAFWKMPAGHKQEADLWAPDPPKATAIRELEGETGITAPAESFSFVDKWFQCGRGDLPGHWKILFVTNVTEADRDRMNTFHRENEGEIPKSFSVNDFHAAVREGRFMPGHVKMLEETTLVQFPPATLRSA